MSLVAEIRLACRIGIHTDGGLQTIPQIDHDLQMRTIL